MNEQAVKKLNGDKTALWQSNDQVEGSKSN